ncbi:uncharacterized protein LOC134676765 [Cydia fagiglandana]|uniref:uncharacterized protein LOC134676765 n=1 Tax=Cydia fagiglandana TaxID=1458189 RepID=UPI002FEDEB8D
MSVPPGQNTMEQAGSSSSDQSSAELELMRLVINCIRQSILVSTQPGPEIAASVCRVIARQARQRYQAVYKLWSDLRAASLRKLRAHLARGDTSPTHQRLSTLEWAVVDLLLLYDSSINVANFFHPAQLAALERTFSLVQVLRLEPERSRGVSPDRWRRAADRYSRKRASSTQPADGAGAHLLPGAGAAAGAGGRAGSVSGPVAAGGPLLLQAVGALHVPANSFHPAQLAALERTFSLVQVLRLEPEGGREVSPDRWRRAARCYCRQCCAWSRRAGGKCLRTGGGGRLTASPGSRCTPRTGDLLPPGQLAALERTFSLVQVLRLEPERGRGVSPDRWRRAADRYCRKCCAWSRSAAGECRRTGGGGRPTATAGSRCTPRTGDLLPPGQLAALELTFSLVQVLRLEPEGGREVSPDWWRRAADRYSRNGVTLSAVALQRRWYEMKQHARQRTCVPATPFVLHAIVHRYPHVAKTELPSWRDLVTAGMVAEPTAVPSPRPEPAIQCKLIQRKTEAHQRHPSVPARKNGDTDDRLGEEDDVHGKSKDEPITAPGRAHVSSNNNNKEKPHCDNTNNIQLSKKICRKEIDNTDIKVKPEIIEIDDDTPSPKADVVEAMQDLDLNNVDAMIIYESDEDVKTIFDVQMGNADKHADIDRNEENSENVKNNKIVEQSKYKIHTSCIIERDIDCDNVMPFKQNGDDSLKTAEDNDNNNKHIDEFEENSMNIVISKVWSERDVQKDNFHNNADNLRNGNSDSDSDSDAISVGNDVDYYSYYKLVLAKYLTISDVLDLKLLKRPVVSLQRLDLKSTNKSPPSQKRQRTIRPSSKLLHGKNKELLKQCKACEVSLTKIDRKGRKTRKVKLPDIEKVRKDNRAILTAEVAPLVAEPSSVVRQYGPARTKRLLNTTDNDQSVLPKKPVLDSSESSILKNIEKTHALPSTCCQDSLIDQQLRQNVLINQQQHNNNNLPSQDTNMFQDCQNNLRKDDQVQNLNVAFDSMSNLMLEMSDNGLHASSVQNLHTGPESQDVSAKHMTTKDTDHRQDWSENMSDTCRVSTVTPIPKHISAPVPKHSVSIPVLPKKAWVTIPAPTPKLPVLIPNPPIRLPKPGSTPIPTVPLTIPPVKLAQPELTPKHSVSVPAPPIKVWVTLPVPTPKLPVLIPNPAIRIPKLGSTPMPTVPLTIPPVKLPQPEPTPKQSVPTVTTPKPLPTPKPAGPVPNPLTMLTSKLEHAMKLTIPEPNLPTSTPKLDPGPTSLIPNPPINVLTPELEPAPAPTPPTSVTPKRKPALKLYFPVPPITFAQIFKPVPIPQTILTPKPNALKSFVPVPNLPTPKLEPFTPVQCPPETLTPKLEPTPEDQPVTFTTKPAVAEPFSTIPDPPSVLQPKLEPTLDPSAPIPTSPTMLTPKSEPSSEPFASASNSTDVDQNCTIYSDNNSPISPVDVNEFNPFKVTPILQTATLLNPTLDFVLEPSRHSGSSTTSGSLPQSALIPDTPTSSKVTLKPSSIHVKKSTTKPCKKQRIKPYILQYALKRSGDQVILKPLFAKKAPTKNTKTPSLPFAPSLAASTSSVERLTKKQRRTRKGETKQTELERGPWRMEPDSVDQSEFDMDMTLAEAYYHLYREDTSFERSVPLLNLL